MIRPSTPLRRDLGPKPPLTQRSTRPTPLGEEKTPTGSLLHATVRDSHTITPHGRAAVRGVELRRANMLTPGNNKRRHDNQQQRETPRGPLRALSRILALSTKPIEPSPQSRSPFPGKLLLAGQDDDIDNGIEIRPSLSMPLDDDEDDSLLLPPLRSTGEAEDENLTQRSIEIPRRAALMEYNGRLSRGSFGSLRTSDRLEELNEIGLDVATGYRDDSSIIPPDDFEDYDVESLRRETNSVSDHQFLEDETGRVSLVSRRTSELTQAMPGDETETTFILSVPQHDSLKMQKGRERLDSPSKGERDKSDELDQGEESEDFGYLGIPKVHLGEQARREFDQVQANTAGAGRRNGKSTKKRVRVSKHGIQYPSLPQGVVKRLATTLLRTSGKGGVKLSKETLEAITVASDWFLDQASDDLGEYAHHAGRKTIDESDVFALMKRQRQTSDMTTPFALAQRYLPRELLQDIRMTRSPMLKRARHLETAQDEVEVD